jgi:peptidoglycan/LPS O-acetylase OafA/YrhL
VIYGVFRLRTRRGDLSLSGLLAASLAVHWVLVHAAPGSLAAAYGDVLDTVIPYLWMFLTGVLLQRHWNRLRGWIAGCAHWWLLGYVLVCSVCREYFHVGAGSNDMELWFLLPLAMVVMSCAISVPTLARRLLAHNDVSYGTYIYHMLVVAVMLQFGARGSVALAAAAVGISVSLGVLSWFLVERPFLRQKHGALRTTSLAAQSAPRPVKSDSLRSSTT